MALDLASYREIAQETSAVEVSGAVTRITGLLIEANGPATRLGGLCEISPKSGDAPIQAEVVGFRDHKILLMPFSSSRGIGPGDRIKIGRAHV